jgi:hypothetical protein
VTSTAAIRKPIRRGLDVPLIVLSALAPDPGQGRSTRRWPRRFRAVSTACSKLGATAGGPGSGHDVAAGDVEGDAREPGGPRKASLGLKRRAVRRAAIERRIRTCCGREVQPSPRTGRDGPAIDARAEGLGRRASQARAFYAVIATSILLG